MTSVFFLTTSQRKIAPPKQTVVQVACCFRIERQVIFTLALHSVRYSPPPPQKKKKLSFCKCGLDAIGKILFFRATKGERKKAKKKQTS